MCKTEIIVVHNSVSALITVVIDNADIQQSSATNYVTRKRERDVTSLRNAQVT